MALVVKNLPTNTGDISPRDLKELDTTERAHSHVGFPGGLVAEALCS